MQDRSTCSNAAEPNAFIRDFSSLSHELGWGSQQPGFGEGSLTIPRSVTVSRNGRFVYVPCSQGSGRPPDEAHPAGFSEGMVSVFTNDGVWVEDYAYGTGPYRLNGEGAYSPVVVVEDALRNTYVSNFWQGKVQIYNSAREPSGVIAVNSSTGLALSPNLSELYVVESPIGGVASIIHHYDLADLQEIDAWEVTGSSGLGALAISHDGNTLWSSETSGSSLYKFVRSGEAWDTFEYDRGVGSYQLALSPDNRILIANVRKGASGNWIQIYASDSLELLVEFNPPELNDGGYTPPIIDVMSGAALSNNGKDLYVSRFGFSGSTMQAIERQEVHKFTFHRI